MQSQKKIQTQKMSLANIKGRLSRIEMKNIMAGSEEPEDCGHENDDCSPGDYCCAGITCIDSNHKCKKV